MVNRRPLPAVVAARQWEIKRRYSIKAKVGKRTRSMAAIRLAELTRWLDDTYGAGVELEPDKTSIDLARLFAHHMGALPNADRRITSWLGDRAAWIKGTDRERLISEVMQCPLKWSADKLAWKIGLNDATRTRLKITTIGAFDVPRDERIKRRKAKQAELQKALRARRKAERQHHIG